VVQLAAIREQARFAGRLLRSLGNAPHVLLYPLVCGALMLAVPVGFVAVVGFTFSFAWSYVGLALGVLVMLVVHPALMVAYAHEVNEVFEGRRPSFGDGLRAARRRGKLVLYTGFLDFFGPVLAERTDRAFRFGGIVANTTEMGVRVGSLFAYPVVATTQTTPRDALAEVQHAVEREWGRAIATDVATKALTKLLVWTSIAGGFLLFFLVLGGARTLSVWPLGPLTLPLLVGVGGVVGAVSMELAIKGLVQTALYRYATDGQPPPALSVDPDGLVSDAE
jgi:hypothetical protein